MNQIVCKEIITDLELMIKYLNSSNLKVMDKDLYYLLGEKILNIINQVNFNEKVEVERISKFNFETPEYEIDTNDFHHILH